MYDRVVSEHHSGVIDHLCEFGECASRANGLTEGEIPSAYSPTLSLLSRFSARRFSGRRRPENSHRASRARHRLWRGLDLIEFRPFGGLQLGANTHACAGFVVAEIRVNGPHGL